MKNIRTPREVNEISEHGEPDQPYVLEYSRDDQILIFFGAIHSNDPEHPEWPVLEDKWREFLEQENGRKLVLYEGRHPASVAGLTEDEALRKYSEGGLIMFRARSAGVPIESPEPERVDELHYLDARFSQAEIVTYLFARQMMQWVGRDHKNEENWEKYADHFLERLNSHGYWNDDDVEPEEVDVNLKNARKWYKQVTGKAFDPTDKESLYKLSDPYQSQVSAASGEYRDDALYQRIKRAWEAGDDVFVIYGSSHAIALEPALADLAGGIIKE